jgi:hypothetical protein
MQKSILQIQLMNGPIMCQCNRKNDPNSDWFHHGTEGLTEINTWLLSESLEHPSCLVPIMRAIRMELVAEDPFTSDDVTTRGMRY